MNAVKNCLVVLAAAVALASCSADPNNSSAGKATLTVSPGSVAMRANTTAEVFASAMDPLGGAVNGTFTVTNATPSVFTAVIDTTYTPVLGGARPQQRTRIVVTALTSGDGSFTITGTGGTIKVPVRVAPDSLNGDITLSKVHLNEIDTFTATLKPGVRFTHGTTVNIYHQATSGDTALFSPVLVGISADSATATIAVGPNSGGRIRFTELANTSTPTITYSARFATIVDNPTLDTSGTDVSTLQVAHVRLDKTAPAVGDTVTATAPAGWRFTPATTVHLYKGPTTNDLNDGQASPVFISLSPDSSTFKFIPGPSGHGQARFTHMVLTSHPALYQYAAARSLDTLTVPVLPTSGTVVFARANSQPNTKVSITLPAGFKFSSGSQATVAGSTLLPIPLGISAAKDTMYALLTPSSSGTVSFSGVSYSVFTGLTFTSTDSVSTSAATDQGNDNPSAGPVPTINMPALGSYGIWDVGSFSVEDSSDDNGWQFGFSGINSQVYQLNLGVAAKVVATITYPTTAADIDVVILQGSGSTNLPDVSSGGTSASHPEVSTASGLSAGTYLVDLIDWGPAFGPGQDAVGDVLRIAVVAQ